MNDNQPGLCVQEALAWNCVSTAPVNEDLDLQLEIMGMLLRTMAREMSRQPMEFDPERPELTDILDHLASTLAAAGEISDSLH